MKLLKPTEASIKGNLEEINARVGQILGPLTIGVGFVGIIYNINNHASVHSFVVNVLVDCFLILTSVILLAYSNYRLSKNVRCWLKFNWVWFLYALASFLYGCYGAATYHGQGFFAEMYIILTIVCACAFYIPPVLSFTYVVASFLLFIGFNQDFLASIRFIDVGLLAFAILFVNWIRYLEMLNITEMNRNDQEKMAHLQVLSTNDELTNVKNRYAMRMDFPSYCQQGKIAVMITDIDDFKFYNDMEGHSVGDKILINFAKCLVDYFGAEHVYRYGGDEFVVLYPNYQEEEFERLTQSFQAAVGRLQFDNLKVPITCSGGYVYGTAKTPGDLRDFIKEADKCLYEAKRQGKNMINGNAYLKEIRSNKTKLHYDELTNLMDIYNLRQVGEKILIDQNYRQKGLSFVFLDLDNFKLINEKHGFKAGDKLLRFAADVIKDAFMQDFIGRASADHFVVISTLPLTEVKDRIKKLHEEIGTYSQKEIIEIKAGIYYLAPDEEVGQVSTYFDKAKLACNSIKYKFNAIYRLYDQSIERELLRRKYIVDNLAKALEDGEIKRYYQPIIRTMTKKVYGLEVLAWWHDDKVGTISPDEFIPTLENVRLIHKFDLYMLEGTLQDYQYLTREKGLFGLPFSINLSRLDFQLCDIFAEVDRLFRLYQVPKEMARIEITESSLIYDSLKLHQTLDNFQKAGYRVWMDDYGSGYSSLSVLKDYSFDGIKIDMGFLKSFEENHKAQLILASTLELAKSMNMQVVAEGVSSKEQYKFLAESGCDFIQGYYTGKPQALTDYIGQLDNLETPADLDYYDEICRRNVANISPNLMANMRLRNFFKATPTAIIEVEDKSRMYFLTENTGFRYFLKLIGYDGDDKNLSIEPADKQAFTDLFERAYLSGKIEYLAFHRNNVLYQIYVQYISTNKRTQRSAYQALVYLPRAVISSE